MSQLKYKQLGNLCAFTRGLTYKKGDEVPFSKNIVLRANNIDLATGKIVFDDLRYINDEVVIPASKYVKKGNIIICTASGSKTHLGKNAYIEEDYGYAFGGFMGQLEPNCEIEGKYLYWFLKSPFYVDWIGNLSDGVNINNLKFDQISQIEIPIIPRSNQRRIVAILDDAFERIDKAIANTEKNIANAKELFESFLTEIFTEKNKISEKCKLFEICKFTVGHVGSMASSYKPKGIPFLRSQNVKPFRIELDGVKFIDEDFHNSLKKSSLSSGDVAIVRTGYPGTAAVIPDDLSIANCSDLVIARPSAKLLPQYLAAFFNSQHGKKIVGGNLVGAAQKHFNVTAAKNVEIALHPMEEQKNIVRHVDEFMQQTDALSIQFMSKLASLQALKQSLLAAAFSGELTADFNPDALEL